MSINAMQIKKSIHEFMIGASVNLSPIYINKRDYGWEIDIKDSDLTIDEGRELESTLSSDFSEVFKVNLSYSENNDDN